MPFKVLKLFLVLKHIYLSLIKSYIIFLTLVLPLDPVIDITKGFKLFIFFSAVLKYFLFNILSINLLIKILNELISNLKFNYIFVFKYYKNTKIN